MGVWKYRQKLVTKYQNKTRFGGPAVNGRVILKEIRGHELY
jgi:hypothetical protein